MGNYIHIVLIILMFLNCFTTLLSDDITVQLSIKDIPTFNGNSPIKTNIFLTFQKGQYLMLFDYQGNLLWYREGKFQNAKVLRINTGQLRYTYGELIFGLEGQTDSYELVVMDEDFQEINRIRGKEHDNIYSGHPFTHDYLYFNDSHYVLLLDFPLYERREFAIQEIKDEEVIFHWESTRHPKLYDWSYLSKIFDYAHVNSIELDYDNNFIISCAYIGFFKVDKNTKKIKWLIGFTGNDFDLMSYQIPKLQHNVHREVDGSIIVYDDGGYFKNQSRVLKYWLEEDKLELVQFKEYIYHQHKAIVMGGVQIIDNEKEILGITYGGGTTNFIMYEEYDFKNNKSLFSITLNDSKSGIYRVTRLLE